MKRTNMYFTDEQHEKLQELSDKTGAPIAELVRRAVDAYLAFAEQRGTWDEALSDKQIAKVTRSVFSKL